jgi:hypothetical protein
MNNQFLCSFSNLNIGNTIKRNKSNTSTPTKVQNKTALAIGFNQRKYSKKREKKIQQPTDEVLLLESIRIILSDKASNF